MRAVWHKRKALILLSRLYLIKCQVRSAPEERKIANQMRAKKLPMVDDLRDESDPENPTRIVVVPRSNRIDCDS